MIGQLELHVVTGCALLLAIEPAMKLQIAVSNWYRRFKIHRAHQRRLCENTPE